MINIIKKLQNYIECLIFINKCYVNIVIAIVTVHVISHNTVDVIDTDTELHKTYFFFNI